MYENHDIVNDNCSNHVLIACHVIGYFCMLKFGIEYVKCDVSVKLWFVGEIVRIGWLIMKMEFWWIVFCDYDGEVVNVVEWIWIFVLIKSFGWEIEFGEKWVFKLKLFCKWLWEICCFGLSELKMFWVRNEVNL